ncbi:MAG TPA: DUF177 domain-containing protein [Chloroflexota bacterium]
MIAHHTRPEPVSLLFNVSQLLKSEIGQSRSYDFAGKDALDLDDGSATDIRGHAKFTLTNFGILANISASGQLHLTCARCLDPFVAPIEVEFDEEFVPSIDIQTGLPSGTPVSDVALPISSDHMIDLGEAIRQQFLLSMDLIPVCSAKCLGLCPTCGVNRNLETCLCPPQEPANPFEVLKTLIQTTEHTQ